GTDIHLAPGQQKHLPHEAWHVVQQKQGRVKPTLQPKASPSFAMRGPIQLFKVPGGLDMLANDLKETTQDIADAGGAEKKDVSLYGSDQWGKDTYFAGLRKLDEWNLVKSLLNSGMSKEEAARVGFGIDDVSEPDALERDDSNNITKAGENKVVGGKFRQVSVNINSALDQLTNGKRANQYGGARLLARIQIEENSEAAAHIIKMSDTVKKGQITRWKNRMEVAYREGLANWEAPCTLFLVILIGNNAIFNEHLEQKKK
ncbi:MAG TPA: hypothetical protein DCR93_21180, partial [Cytophagales bacterium]|nr:hypothetical protein [Cytophagales bacterium]